MEPSRPAVAEQAFELALLEHPKTAREIERAIDDTPRCLDGVVLCRHDLDRPGHAMVDTLGPIARDGLELRPDRFEVERDLCDTVLDPRVVGHRPGQPQRAL